MTSDPHANEPVQRIGVELKQAKGAVIMLHGRGASAEDILNLAQAMYHPQLTYLAPSAAGHSWYPYSFLAPREQNEPYLSSALKKIASTIRLIEESGIPQSKIVICGFSQGACLSTEFVATHPAKYAGVLAFTGGLIGPLEMKLDYAGDLQGTPAFFGSGDPDPHVPWSRVQQSADVLESMNARVTVQRYPGRPHTVSGVEVQIGRQMLAEAFGTVVG